MNNPFLVLVTLFSLLAPPSLAEAADQATPAGPVYLQAALGDSITAAFLANTSLSDKSQYNPPPGVSEEGLKIWIYMRSLLENKNELSWASGNEVPSHYGLLTRYIKKNKIQGTLVMYNAAVSGAKLSDMVTQANTVVKAMKTGKYAGLEYVTIMAGANDACNERYRKGTPEAIVRRSVLDILSRFATIKQAGPIRILVLGAPRIPDLGAPAIANSTTVGGMTCGTLQRRILRACPILTEWKTEAEYRENMVSVARKNLAIRSAVQEAALRYPQLDVMYSDRMFEKPLKRSDLAIDCFHPNRYAHGIIASISWPDQPWFK